MQAMTADREHHMKHMVLVNRTRQCSQKMDFGDDNRHQLFERTRWNRKVCMDKILHDVKLSNSHHTGV
ncbi:hypothetical protein Mapa_011156 [Marchantia paleacea]|nr:hypothetical protein Mapa_011156 [Marchantia paleacea]